MNDLFWKNKKVLVTGHTGFKGSWLSLWLDKLGATVHGYSLAPSTNPSLYEVAKLKECVQSTINDIRDRSALTKCVQDFQPDIVFHLAAQPIVRESYVDPLATLETNVMGTAHLLEAVRSCSCVKAVVVVTSDKCYLNREWQWGYREDEALGGHDPYSASKACTELVTQSWRQSFFEKSADAPGSNYCAVATARAGNVIGGGDWSKDRLIPDILESLGKGEPVVLRNPDAIRPWQHVLEPLAGYLLLAEKLYTEGEPWAQAWNFGPHDSDTQTVSWIVEQLIKEGNGKGNWNPDANQNPHEAQLLKLDSSKARQELGWKNLWPLKVCLEEIATWHESWQKGADMNKVSLETLDRYESAYPLS